MNCVVKKWIRLAVLLLAGMTLLRADSATEPRGGRVGWARLITPIVAWKRHAEADGVLASFIRNKTSLNIDATWYSADPRALDQLCLYPLLFTNNLADVTDRKQLANIAEYLRRGGFLLVDACINSTVTPNPDRFYQQHVAVFSQMLPTAQLRPLPPDHEIYRHYFNLKQTPPHSYMRSIRDPKWERYGLFGLYDGDRMVAILSLSGLQCGWAGSQEMPGHDVECMKMTVNIYVYAMTRTQ